jgi:hypothetical protein
MDKEKLDRLLRALQILQGILEAIVVILKLYELFTQ